MRDSVINGYSKDWFDIFLNESNQLYTKNEVEFLERQLPKGEYKKILDLCCGIGRHSNLLGELGYKVIGIDRDEGALTQAREYGNKNTTYIKKDMRELNSLEESYDGIINLWHSFGYFDKETNETIISEISSLLRDSGIFIVDIYNKEYFDEHIGERTFIKNKVEIYEKIEREGNRFNVELSYNSGKNGRDVFQWTLYTRDEFITMCKKFRLEFLLGCEWYDEEKPINNESVRMQLVLKKVT